jgi:hypothetical protein
MLRSSLRVLSKYAPGSGSKISKGKVWANQSQLSRIKDSSEHSSRIEDKNVLGGDSDRISVISRVSFKDTQSMREGRARLDAQFESLSSPLVAHRDKEYS